MSSQQPRDPRDPRDLPRDPALTGAAGCLAGAGMVVLVITGVLVVLVLVGALLLYLTCGGH